MKTLEAIKYLVRNGSHHSEWAEAALLGFIEEVLKNEDREYEVRELDQMVELAAEN